jgi:hypothetical protein
LLKNPNHEKKVEADAFLMDKERDLIGRDLVI